MGWGTVGFVGLDLYWWVVLLGVVLDRVQGLDWGAGCISYLGTFVCGGLFGLEVFVGCVCVSLLHRWLGSGVFYWFVASLAVCVVVWVLYCVCLLFGCGFWGLSGWVGGARCVVFGLFCYLG